MWSLQVITKYVWVSCSSFLPQSRDMQFGVRLVGNSKLKVSVRVDVVPVMDW